MPSNNDLVTRYLHAIGFWLPRATRQDILAEISEDLHSQIDDRAAGLACKPPLVSGSASSFTRLYSSVR